MRSKPLLVLMCGLLLSCGNNQEDEIPDFQNLTNDDFCNYSLGLQQNAEMMASREGFHEIAELAGVAGTLISKENLMKNRYVSVGYASDKPFTININVLKPCFSDDEKVLVFKTFYEVMKANTYHVDSDKKLMEVQRP